MSRSTMTPHANLRRSLLLTGASTAALAALPGYARAQEKYPSRPIDFIVPWGREAGPTRWRGASASCSKAN